MIDKVTRSRLFIDNPGHGVFRVNRDLYTSPEVLQLEQERIFSRCWLYLGHASEISRPNGFITRTVAGRDLLFTRSLDGKLAAYYNNCRHRGATLCRERRGTRKNFACPYHGWLYDAAGNLINVPGRANFLDTVFDDGSLNLKPVARIEAHHDFVFVSFSAAMPPLVDYLADAGDVLELIAQHGPHGMEVVPGTHEYAIPANWKLLIENSNDGYHAGPTHASYFDIMREQNAGFGQRQDTGIATLVGTPAIAHGIRLLGNGHSVISTEGPWGRPCARWTPAWGEPARIEIDGIAAEIQQRLGSERGRQITGVDRNIVLFPNTMINDVMGIAIRTCHPGDPAKTSVSAWSLAPIGEGGGARERRNRSFLEFFGPSGFATPDDIEMLSICQRSYTGEDGDNWNDVSKGIGKADMAVDDEEQQRNFWRRWRDMVAA